MPAPELATRRGAEELDFLFLQYPCGNVDGAVYLGAPEKVIVVGRAVRMDTPARYVVRYSLRPDGDRPSDSWRAGRRGQDGSIALELIDAPCSALTVELVDGDVSSQFAARLATSEGDCPSEAAAG